jgi:ATP-dependent Lon protease
LNFAIQNLYTRAGELLGNRNTREHEFTVQLRSFDAAKSGALARGSIGGLGVRSFGAAAEGGLSSEGST